MTFPRNDFEAWALPHFSGGDAEAVVALAELDSKGDYRSTEMRAARDAWQQLAEQRDALVMQLREQLNDCINFDGGKLTDEVMERSSQLLKGRLSNALARRDAEQQAAAIDKWSATIIRVMEVAAAKHDADPNYPPISLQMIRELCCDMDDDADRLRGQTEEGS